MSRLNTPSPVLTYYHGGDAGAKLDNLIHTWNDGGFEDSTTVVERSQNYAFIKMPNFFEGKRLKDRETQKDLLNWLEEERSKGNKLVGSFESSMVWLFETTSNSVRFIRDDD